MLKLVEAGAPSKFKPKNMRKLTVDAVNCPWDFDPDSGIIPLSAKKLNGEIVNDNPIDETDGTDEGFINVLKYGTNPITSVGEACDGYGAIVLALRNTSTRLLNKGYFQVEEVLEDPQALEKDVEAALIIRFIANNNFGGGGGEKDYVATKAVIADDGQTKSAMTLEVLARCAQQACEMNWSRLENVRLFGEDLEYGKDCVVELSIDSTKSPPKKWFAALLRGVMATIIPQYKLGGEDGSPMLQIKGGEIHSQFMHTGTFLCKKWIQDRETAQAIANDGVPVFMWLNAKEEYMYFHWAICFNDNINSLIGGMARHGIDCVNAIHDAMDVPAVKPAAMKDLVDKGGRATAAASFARQLAYRLYKIQNELDEQVKAINGVDKELRLQVERDAKVISNALIEAMCAETRLMAGNADPEVLGKALFEAATKDGNDSVLLRSFPQEKMLLAQDIVDGSTRWTTDLVVSIADGVTLTEGMKAEVTVKGTRLFADGKEIARVEAEVPEGEYELHQVRRVTGKGAYTTEWYACANIRERTRIPEYTGRTTLFYSAAKKTALGYKRLARTLIGQTLTIKEGKVLKNGKTIEIPLASGNAAQRTLLISNKVPTYDKFAADIRTTHYAERTGVVKYAFVVEVEPKEGEEAYELVVLLEDAKAPQKFRKLDPSQFPFEAPKVTELEPAEELETETSETENSGEMSEEEKAEFKAEYGDDFLGCGNDNDYVPTDEELAWAHGDEHGNDKNGSDGDDDFEKALEGLNVVTLDDLEEALKGLNVVSVADLAQYV